MSITLANLSAPANQSTILSRLAISALLTFGLAVDSFAQSEGLSDANFADIHLFPAGNADEATCSFSQPNSIDDVIRLTAVDNVFKIRLSERLSIDPAAGEIVYNDSDIATISVDQTSLLNRLKIDRQDDSNPNGIEFDLSSGRQVGLIATSTPKFDLLGFDVGSDFPFLITNDARTGSMVLRELGVGVGTLEPAAALHVFAGPLVAGPGKQTFENAKIIVENQLATTGSREMFSLINNGASRFTMENTSNNTKWGFASDALGRFTFSLDGTPGPEFAITPSGRVTMGPGNTQNFDLRPNGNLIIAGTLIQSSDENLKSNYEKVDEQIVLDKVSELPVSTWNFNFDDPQIRHLGPTAQDFREAFELGHNDTTIAPIDGIGVSLVSIKALHQRIQRQRSQIERQSDLIDQLTKRLEKLEAAEN